MECKDFEPSIIQDNEEETDINNNIYINISKASSSSLIKKADASIALNSFVPINKVAEVKRLTSNRSLRIAIQKCKYIAREIKVQGGKSVASGVGTILALNWIVGLIIALVWCVITYTTKYVSVGSIIALIISPFVMYFLGAPIVYIAYRALGTIYIVYLHRENIKRLINGNENKVR